MIQAEFLPASMVIPFINTHKPQIYLNMSKYRFVILKNASNISMVNLCTLSQDDDSDVISFYMDIPVGLVMTRRYVFQGRLVSESEKPIHFIKFTASKDPSNIYKCVVEPHLTTEIEETPAKKRHRKEPNNVDESRKELRRKKFDKFEKLMRDGIIEKLKEYNWFDPTAKDIELEVSVVIDEK